MANQRLVSYIKEQLKSGYDINAIRDNLIHHGYNRQVIEESIHQAYKKSLTLKQIVPVLTVLAALIIVFISFLFLRSPIPQELLDIQTTILSKDISSASLLEFNTELINMGSSSRYDVILEHSILDKDNNIITSSQESIAIMTKASKVSRIALPDNILPGDYTLKTIAFYKDDKAISSAMFTVKGKTEIKQEPYDDSVKDVNNKTSEDSQDTSDTKPTQDSLGVLPKDCPVNCDDLNPCTIDICDPDDTYICKHKLIQPCCPNDVCEEGENYKSCPSDCIREETFKILSLDEILSHATQLASQDSQEAKEYCLNQNDQKNKDSCLKTIAELTRINEYCDLITSDTRRDQCFGTFASLGDFSVCPKITNTYMRQSCEALKG